MGALRGVLFVIVCILFFLSVFTAGMFYTVSSSMEYENVKANAVSIVTDVMEEQFGLEKKFEQVFPLMKIYCEDYSNYSFFYQGYNFSVPCELVSQGYEPALEYGVGEFVEDIYYKDYECGFWDCFEKEGLPLFLLSKQTKDYVNSKFYLFLTISFILAGLMFFLAEKKSNMLITAGSLMIVASLPFMKLSEILSAFTAGGFVEFLSIFFTNSYSTFINLLIFGIAFLVLGIILKIFKFGFKISNFISKIKEKRKKTLNKKEDKKIKSNGGFSKNKKEDKKIKNSDFSKNKKEKNISKNKFKKSLDKKDKKQRDISKKKSGKISMNKDLEKFNK